MGFSSPSSSSPSSSRTSGTSGGGELNRFLSLAAVLPKYGAGVAIATLISCYLVAVFVEGKTPWLLDITHYSKDVPASFIFRIGILPSCTLIAASWQIAGSWMQDLAALGSLGAESPRQSGYRKWAARLGSVAAMCLVVSSSLENGNQTVWPVHVIFATTFFILTMVASVLTTLNLRDLRTNANAPVNTQTLRLREAFAGVGVALLIFDALSSSPILKSVVPVWTPRLCEWLASFDIIGYIGLFSIDWKQSYDITTQLDTTGRSDRIKGATPEKRFLSYAKVLPQYGAGVAIATLISCYLVAVFVEGKTPWLLDITHYSKDVPASFIFRIGMIPACAVIAASWQLAGSWMQDLAAAGDLGAESPRQSGYRKWAARLGSVAGGCLIISSSVMNGEQTVWPVHVFFASSFFVLTMIASVLTTLNLRDLRTSARAPVSAQTLRLREVVAGVGVALIVFDALSSSPLLKGVVPSWTPHLMEWLATFDIISFIGLFAVDWKKSFDISTALKVQQRWYIIQQ